MEKISNLDLTKYNSYRVKSIAKTAYIPSTKEDFISIFQEHNISEIVVIGGGFNIILSKNYYDDLIFVIIKDSLAKIEVSGNCIYAQAGANLKKLSEIALENSLSGLEYFYDIPGTVGGALVMNAGSKGEDIGSLVKEINIFDASSKEELVLSGEQLNSTYRQSIFQDNKNLIVLSTIFILELKPSKSIQRKMLKNKELRWSKQPREFPNAGSVFKRPSGFYVGEMIEQLGLKGYSIGGAMVSEKHAGFIVNYNNATSIDIIELINLIKLKVFEKYNINLEVEQRIL